MPVSAVETVEESPRACPAARATTDAVAPADMTSDQLVRRAKVIEEVIGLIGAVGADAVQMRDVAQRPGCAGHPLSLFQLEGEPARRRAGGLAEAPDPPHPAGWRPPTRTRCRSSWTTCAAPSAFHRNPAMTALMLQTMTSTDPEVQPAIEQMERNNREMFDRILNGVAPENFANVSFGLNAALSAALTGLLTGRLTSPNRWTTSSGSLGCSSARPARPAWDARRKSGPTLVPRAYVWLHT